MRIAALCAALAALALSASAAWADSADPLPGFPFHDGFEGPCGLAVDSLGNPYVADYYHDEVGVFKSSLESLAQLPEEDPLDGPCSLAVGVNVGGVSDAGSLYVNNFHRNVVRFTPTSFPFGKPPFYGAAATIDSAESTGVAVDPATGNVYVDDRTYIAVYEPSGAPLEVGGEPLRIGLGSGPGSLQDGYGLAVSGHTGTEGFLYVADAATGTVKVYDPPTSTENPVEVIDGSETPEGGFVSLCDAVVAVDQTSGRVYVADDLQPEYYEHPEAAVYAFDPSGTYAGRLKYNIVDAMPPGLAIGGERVYVTSGNSYEASIIAYGIGALTKSVFPAQATAGPAGGPAAQARALAAGSAAAPPGLAPFATASEIAQQGKLRVTVTGKLSPRVLPRRGTAPIAVFIGGHISTTDASAPPQLKGLRIEFNRLGQLESRGLPVCHPDQIQPASSARALAACRGSLVGEGSFRANIVLSGQAPYPTEGRLLVFNGARHGKAVLLGQIYAAKPFATSFLIPFAVRHISAGRYGTALTASLPRALGSWGYLTAISLELSRRYAYRGSPRSFISAGCPAPAGFPGAVFALARMRFSFAGGRTLSSTLTRSCGARG